MGCSHPCNLFSTLRVFYMTFLLFEILCRKVKRLDQSQDYFHLVPKRFLEVGGNRVFGQSSKNLFESFLCYSSCSYFVSLRVLLYQSECMRVFLFSIVSKFSQQFLGHFAITIETKHIKMEDDKHEFKVISQQATIIYPKQNNKYPKYQQEKNAEG